MSDENLELEETQEEEGTDLALPEEIEETLNPEENSDPLDAVEDIEELRNKAKGYRSAFQKAKSKTKPVAEEKPTSTKPDTGYITKEDFYKANEKKAIRQVSQDDFVKENWDKIISFYVNRKGKDTPEDIAEDINDAVLLFKAKNPAGEQDTSAKELSTTPGQVKGSTGKKAPEKKETLPIKTPKKPDEWYPKTE